MISISSSRKIEYSQNWRITMDTFANLSFEQEFNLRVYQEQVKNLSLKEAQEFLLEVLRQSMVKENLFKQLLKTGI
jgi:Phycobilisome degradation protein nblA